MNTKDFLRLGVPLGEATRRATDFVSKFILSGGDKTKLEEELKAIVANRPIAKRFIGWNSARLILPMNQAWARWCPAGIFRLLGLSNSPARHQRSQWRHLGSWSQCASGVLWSLSAILLVAGAASKAAVIYQTGFETSEGYNTNLDLIGQNG